MTPDVLTQLRTYAADLDDQAPSLEDLMPVLVETRRPQPSQPRKRRWAAAALAAVVALILIGGLALLTIIFGNDDEIIDQPTPTITTPEVTPDAGGAWAQVSDSSGVFENATIVSIVNGPSQLVAVGNVPQGLGVWTSIDGATWSRVPHDEALFGPGEDNYLNVVGAAAGDSGIVALGASWKNDTQTPLAWYSADGSAWTRVALDDASEATVTEMRAVSAGGPGFVAVGMACDTGPGCNPWEPYPMVWTSVDGSDWTPITDANEVFAPETVLTEIVSYDGRLWAFGFLSGDGQDYRVWTSTDGLAWERVADDAAFGGPGNQGLGAAAAGEGGVVAAGFNWTEEDGTEPIAWYSPDGSSWTRIDLEPRLPGLTVWDMAASGTGFVAVGDLGDSAFELGLSLGFVLRSEDGLTWEKVDDPSFADAQLMTVSPGGPGLVAAGRTATASAAEKAPVWMSSPGTVPATDTTVPSTSTTSTAVITEPLPSGDWTRWPADPDVFGDGGVLDVVAGGPGVVAVGGASGSGAVWLSEDGITWERLADDSHMVEGFIRALTAGDKGIVAVGRDNEAGASAWFSPDGIEWTRSVLPSSIQAFDVVATDTGYVAVGRDEGRFDGDIYVDEGAVWTSPDGIAWNRVPHDPAVFDDAYPTAIVLTDEGLVAVGVLYQDTGFGVWSSPDGTTWTKRVADTSFPGPGHLWDLTVGTPGLVAVGNFGGVWFSRDGLAWQDVSEPGWSFRSVAPSGGGFVAVGHSGCDASGCTTAVWNSPDGITWSEQPAEPGFFDGEMSAIRAAGPGLIAFSTIYSGPGEPSGIGQWTWGN